MTNRPQQINLFLGLLPIIFLGIFFLVPLLIVLVYSFLAKGTYGGVSWVFTLDNYQRLTDHIYWAVLGRSLWFGFLTTLTCLIIGYPMSFFIATRSPKWRKLLIFLIIIPFWTNFLIRTYAWIVLLGNQGVINTLLQHLHLTSAPLKLLFTPSAVIIGLIYGYLPFMILPIYTVIEKFDFSLIEAAGDLGANDWRTFIRVLFPLSLQGVIAGCILVFVPTVGALITPDILGGGKVIMIGNLIQSQFLRSRDWGFGSALSMIVMVIILIPVLVYLKFAREKV